MRRLVALVALMAVLFCAAVVAVGLRLAAPRIHVVGPPPDDLPVEAVRLDSPSGSSIGGWWIPGTSGGGAVVLLHGVTADRRMMVRRARFLHARGFATLSIDFQAEGESPGRHITFGALESLDAAAAVAYVRARLPRERVGVIGVSLGAAAAVLGPRPLSVDALVLESMYPTIDDALFDRISDTIGGAVGAGVASVLTPAFLVLLPPLIGVGPEQLRPIDRIGATTAPLLLISGSADRHTLIAEARALFARAPEPKSFWAVEGAGHINLESFGPGAYWERVLPFLERWLR